MKILRHILEQPFVFATGLAALIHSTWTVGTFFSGLQPNNTDILGTVFWLIPAFLIAFALDVGQIVTSSEIRAGDHSWSKRITFLVFAVATYYLQFLFVATHMPDVPLTVSIRPDWTQSIQIMRDAAVFALPLLLPLSTLMYTYSQKKKIVIPSEPSKELAVIPQLDHAAMAQPDSELDIHRTITVSRNLAKAPIIYRRNNHHEEAE